MMPYHESMHPEITRIRSMLEGQGYVADQALATSVYLAIQLRKPLLIEGAADVGKTEVAKVMARALDADLIRLQCYEGLDVTTSLYEWNYQRQLPAHPASRSTPTSRWRRKSAKSSAKRS